MSRQHRVVGRLTTSAWAFDVQRTGAGSPWPVRTITIPDGDYYVSSDGAADDLCDVIVDLVAVHAELAGFALSALADGRARISTSGYPATITWTAAGEDLRDTLRYAGATLDISSTAQVGSRVCATLHYPTFGLSLDDRVRRSLGRQIVMADGRIEADDWGTTDELEIRWHYSGPARSTDATEYRELESLWDDVVCHSYPLRLYPDRTITAAYDSLTAPYGYETWVALGPPEWAPQRVIPGVCVAYSAQWRLRRYVP